MKPPTTPVAKHQVQGHTFDSLCKTAENHGFYLEWNDSDGEGGGNNYELWSNERAPGITGVYETLAEVAGDVLIIEQGGNPLYQLR